VVVILVALVGLVAAVLDLEPQDKDRPVALLPVADMAEVVVVVLDRLV
jgi:hypothetical protein